MRQFHVAKAGNKLAIQLRITWTLDHPAFISRGPTIFILSISSRYIFFSCWWWCLCMVSFTCVSCTEKSMSGDSAAYLIFDKVFHALTHCKLPRVPGIALPCLSSTTIIIMPPCPAYFFLFFKLCGCLGCERRSSSLCRKYFSY